MSSSNTDQNSRLQIDNSVLASLITLSQQMGQIQGEISVLKAYSSDISSLGSEIAELEDQLKNIDKIVLTGDLNQESLNTQIQKFKNILFDVKSKISDLEKTMTDMEDKTTKVTLMNVENIWKVVMAIVGFLTTVGLAWLGFK